MCFACLRSTNIKPCVASVSNTNVMFVTFVLAGFVLTEWFVPSSSQLCGKARFLHLADHFGAPPSIILLFTVLPRHRCLNVSKYLIVGYSSYWQELVRRILMLPLAEIGQNRQISPNVQTGYQKLGLRATRRDEKLDRLSKTVQRRDKGSGCSSPGDGGWQSDTSEDHQSD